MKSSHTAALTLAAALTLLFPVIAFADEVEVYERRSSTVDGVTTTTETTTTTVVPGASITADAFVTTLEGRRLQLEAAIAAGQAAGKITDAQAKLWRAELDAIARAQAAGKTTLTYVDALPLAMSLDRLGDVVRVVAPTLVYVPMISGQRFIISGGRVIMLDDIMVRRADLESKISRELAIGKITSKQANSLRTEMSAIAKVETGMREKGPFSDKDSRLLYVSFDRVGSRLDGYIKR